MATDYRQTKKPTRPWTDEEQKRFIAARKTLRFESYPNGRSGWQDRPGTTFTDAGFKCVKSDNGDPANVAIKWYDIA